MNTSSAPRNMRRSAVLLALALTAGPLLARQDDLAPKNKPMPPGSPAGLRERPERPEKPERPELPEPPEPPEPTDANGSGADVGARIHAEMARAQADIARAARQMKRRVEEVHVSFSGAQDDRQLILPADDAPAESISGLREELAIMARLFAKAADPETGKRNAFRVDLWQFGLGKGRDLDALYLDGYGAVFLLAVDFPLVDAPKAAEKKDAAKADKDAAWEQARRELTGKGGDLSDDLERDDDPEPAKFDADKVAGLRKRLAETFRHATNLKSVKAGEQIVVQVVGKASRHTSGNLPPRMDPLLARRYGLDPNAPTSPSDGPTTATLTLRAKKSDVDAFAAGRLSAEEFGKKLTGSTREENAPAKPSKKKRDVF